jgi:hypothetical protein
MFDVATITFDEMTDEAIEAELAAGDGRGKPSIYKPVLVQLLSAANGCNVSGTLSYKEINPDAKERQNVLAGMRGAIKKNAPTFDRITIRAGVGDDDVKVTVRREQNENDA